MGTPEEVKEVGIVRFEGAERGKWRGAGVGMWGRGEAREGFGL